MQEQEQEARGATGRHELALGADECQPMPLIQASASTSACG
ncbi:hypothetical protein SynRCC2555_02401 [Synechococcus sp. WH 8101]|nr:hypothetical protein SynRCC2555_02401 [Synechococcus sp. WH 8101]